MSMQVTVTIQITDYDRNDTFPSQLCSVFTIKIQKEKVIWRHIQPSGNPLFLGAVLNSGYRTTISLSCFANPDSLQNHSDTSYRKGVVGLSLTLHSFLTLFTFIIICKALTNSHYSIAHFQESSNGGLGFFNVPVELIIIVIVISENLSCLMMN